MISFVPPDSQYFNEERKKTYAKIRNKVLVLKYWQILLKIFMNSIISDSNKANALEFSARRIFRNNLEYDKIFVNNSKENNLAHDI